MIPTINGLGATFIISLMWYFVFLTEMLLLFVPIYFFLSMIRKLFNGNI